MTRNLPSDTQQVTVCDNLYSVSVRVLKLLMAKDPQIGGSVKIPHCDTRRGCPQYKYLAEIDVRSEATEIRLNGDQITVDEAPSRCLLGPFIQPRHQRTS